MTCRSPVPFRDPSDTWKRTVPALALQPAATAALTVPLLLLMPPSASMIMRRRGAGSAYTRGMGQKVHILDPFGAVKLDVSLKSRFNPLDALDPGGEETVDEVARIAETLIVTQNSNDPFWEESARALLKALILHVLTERDFEGMRSLVTVRRLLSQGDWITVDLLRQHQSELRGLATYLTGRGFPALADGARFDVDLDEGAPRRQESGFRRPAARRDRAAPRRSPCPAARRRPAAARRAAPPGIRAAARPGRCPAR